MCFLVLINVGNTVVVLIKSFKPSCRISSYNESIKPFSANFVDEYVIKLATPSRPKTIFDIEYTDQSGTLCVR